MNIPPHIFKGYDIRAIYPTEISEENTKVIVKAIYYFLSENSQKQKPLTVALGHDMRISSPSLFAVMKEALVESGAEVVDLGLVTTPSVYFAVSHYGYDAGLQLTASHNTKEYNGIKIVTNFDKEKGLVKIGKTTGMETIKQYAIEGKEVTIDNPGSVVPNENVLRDEVESSLKMTGNPQIKNLRVVADAANAMGAVYLEALFEKLPCELIKMNFELDGTFPVHQADPLQLDTLVELQKRVVEEKADLGLAPDGDGDRLFFIDEKGEVVPPTIITSIISRELLKKHPGATILYDIRYILTPEKIIEEEGGKSDITKVGHAFITEKMRETGAVFGGESSSHFFFKETGNAEAQMPVVLMVLDVLSREGKTLSQLVEELRRSCESGEFNFEVKNAPQIMEEIKSKYSDGELSTLDGIAITYPEFRFSLRTSNTEPLMRLNVEAHEKSVMEEKRDEIMDLIKTLAQ